MSKLVWVNYRISDAEERETRRKIELLRRTLARCAVLREQLSELEPVAGEDWAVTLAKYEQMVDLNRWKEFTSDYNRLYEELPAVAERLEQALAKARAQRTRLELTAATLAALGASPEENALLAELVGKAEHLYADKYAEAAGKVEAILRKRLDTALVDKPAAPAASQLALAAELLEASGLPTETLPAPVVPVPGCATDAARISRLANQIGSLDTSMGSYDDLLERLRELPSAEAGRRVLLLDSIELAAAERLSAARSKREVHDLVAEGQAWLTSYDSLSADEHRRRLEAAAVAGEPAGARAARDDARRWADEESRRQDGARVRSTLVAELRGLGYEVNVQGDWTEGQRITAARPNEPNYDVQLAAIPGGQIQSKVRAYNHAGRSQGVNRRDVEVEQNWCDDLEKLNALLAERGIGAEILRQDGPGTAAQTPLPARDERRNDGTAQGRQLERK